MISDLLLVRRCCGNRSLQNRLAMDSTRLQQPVKTGDGPIEGGVSYIVISIAETTIPIIGTAWENANAIP